MASDSAINGVGATKRRLCLAALLLERARPLSLLFIPYNEPHPVCSSTSLPRKLQSVPQSRDDALVLLPQGWFVSFYLPSWPYSVFAGKGQLRLAQAGRGKTRRSDLFHSFMQERRRTCLLLKLYDCTTMSVTLVLHLFYLLFRRDSPSSPASKKAKGPGSHITIDHFFR